MAQDPSQSGGSNIDWEAFHEEHPSIRNAGFGYTGGRDPGPGISSLDESFDRLHSLNPDVFTKKAPPMPEVEQKTLGWNDAWAELARHPERFIPYISAISEVSELSSLHKAALASEKGTATEEQMNALMEFTARAQADKTIGYHVAHILGMLPAFIGEVWSGGAIARQAGTKLMGKTIREAIESSAARNSRRAIGRAVRRRGLATGNERLAKRGQEMAGRRISLDILGHRLSQATGTFAATETVSGGLGLLTTGEFGSRGGASAYRRALGEAGMYVTEDEAGELHLSMMGTVGDFLENLPMGLLDSFIEQVSERAGRELMAIPGLNQLESLKIHIAKRWMAKGNRTVRELSTQLNKAGWHGPIEEWMEERFGGALRSLTMVGEDEFIWQREDGEEGRINWNTMFPGGKQMLAEFIAFQVPGPAMAAAKRIAVGKPVESAAARETQLGQEEQTLNESEFRDTAEEWYGYAFEELHAAAKEAGVTFDDGTSLRDNQKFVQALSGFYGEEATQQAFELLAQDEKLAPMAQRAGITGFNPLGQFDEGSPEMRDARRFVDTYDHDGGKEARIVEPDTPLRKRMLELWNKVFPDRRILFVEGGKTFNGSASGFHTSSDGGTVYINAATSQNRGFMSGLTTIGHELGVHQLFEENPELGEALAAAIDNISGEWLDLAWNDGLMSWALADMRERGQGTIPAAPDYETNLQAALERAEMAFEARHGVKGSEGYQAARREESTATLLTPSKQAVEAKEDWTQIAPLMVFLSLQDGVALVEELRKTPGMLGKMREFFIRTAERLGGKKLPKGEAGRIQRLLTNVMQTDVSEGSDSYKVAMAFHEAWTGILQTGVLEAGSIDELQTEEEAVEGEQETEAGEEVDAEEAPAEAPTEAPEAAPADADLAAMSQDEFADYLASVPGLPQTDYALLTARPEHRGPLLRGESPFAEIHAQTSAEERAQFDEMLQEFRSDPSSTTSTYGWTGFNFGDTAREEAGRREKGYVTLQDAGQLTAEQIRTLFQRLEAAGYNGAFKMADSLTSFQSKFDNFVFHGRNAAEVQKALQIAEKVFAGNVASTQVGFDTDTSHTTNLAASVQARREAREAPAEQAEVGLDDIEVRRVMRSGNRSALETQAKELGIEEPEGFKNKGELAAEIVRRQRAQKPRGDTFAPPFSAGEGAPLGSLSPAAQEAYFDKKLGSLDLKSHWIGRFTVLHRQKFEQLWALREELNDKAQSEYESVPYTTVRSELIPSIYRAEIRQSRRELQERGIIPEVTKEREEEGFPEDQEDFELYSEAAQRRVSEDKGDMHAPPVGLFHGSGVRGIEQFSTEFLGTGQGAMAQGWGLYLSEAEGVGRYHQEYVATRAYKYGGSEIRVDTVPPISQAINGDFNNDPKEDFQELIEQVAEDTGVTDPDKALDLFSRFMEYMLVDIGMGTRRRLKGKVEMLGELFDEHLLEEYDMTEHEMQEGGHDMMKELKAIETSDSEWGLLYRLAKAVYGKGEYEGATYEVTADFEEDDTLVWDKPLREQHPDVQRKALSALAAIKRIAPIEEAVAKNLTGHGVYRHIADAFDTPNDYGGPAETDPVRAEEASLLLDEHGIKAHKYEIGEDRGKELAKPRYNYVSYRPDRDVRIDKEMHAPPFSLGPNAPGEFRRQPDREAAIEAARDSKAFNQILDNLAEEYEEKYGEAYDDPFVGLHEIDEEGQFTGPAMPVFDFEGVGLRAPYLLGDPTPTAEELQALISLQRKLLGDLSDLMEKGEDASGVALKIWKVAQQTEAGFFEKYQNTYEEVEREFWRERWNMEFIQNQALRDILKHHLPSDFDFDEPMFAPPTEDLIHGTEGVAPVLLAPVVTGDEEGLPMKPPRDLLLDGDQWVAWSPERELLGVFKGLEDVLPGLLNTFASPQEGAEYGLSFRRDPAYTGAALDQATQRYRDLKRAKATEGELEAASLAITSERNRLGGHYKVTGATVGRPAVEGQTESDRSAIFISKGSSTLNPEQMGEGTAQLGLFNLYDDLVVHPNAINVEGATTYEAPPLPESEAATLMMDVGSEAATQEERNKQLDELENIDPDLKPVYRSAARDKQTSDERLAEAEAEDEEVFESVRGARESVYRSRGGRQDPFINYRRSPDGYVLWTGEGNPLSRKPQRDELQVLTDYAKRSEQSSDPKVKVAARELRKRLEELQHGEEPILATINKEAVRPQKKLAPAESFDESGMYMGISPYNGEPITLGVYTDSGGKRVQRVSDGRIVVDLKNRPKVMKPWQARRALRLGRMAAVDKARNALTTASIQSTQYMALSRALADLESRRRMLPPQFDQFDEIIAKLKRRLREWTNPGELSPSVKKADEAKIEEFEEAKRHADFRSGRLTNGLYFAPEDPKATETKANRERLIGELTDRVEEVKADIAEQAAYTDAAVRQAVNLPEEEAVTTADRRTAIKTDESVHDAHTRIKAARKKLSNLEATLRHIKDAENGYQDGRFFQGAAGKAIEKSFGQPMTHTVIIRGSGATLVPEINTRYNESDASLRLLGGLLDEREVDFLRREMGLEKEIDAALKKQNSVAGAKLTMGQIRDLQAGGFEVDFVADFDARQSGKMRQTLLRNPSAIETWLTVEDGGSYLLEDIDAEELSPAERVAFVLDRLNVHDEAAQATLMEQLADIEVEPRLDSIVKAYHMLRIGQHGAGTYTYLNHSSDTAMFAPPAAQKFNENLMRPSWTRVHAAMEGVWNRLMSVEMMEDELRSRGIDITDKEWVSLKEKLRGSQTDAEWVAIQEEFEAPIAAWFESHPEISWFAAGAWLQAHHGITRNEVLQPYIERTMEKYWAGGPYIKNEETGVQEPNPDYNESEYRYWKKRDGKASGDTTENWQKQINHLKKGYAPTEVAGAQPMKHWKKAGGPIDLDAMADLSALVQRVSHKVLDIYVDAGLINEVDADTMKEKYPDYVPFEMGGGQGEVAEALLIQGAMTDTEAEAWAELGQKGQSGVSVTGSGIRFSYGRGSRPVNDPIARLIGRMDVAHQKWKRAQVGRSLLNLARLADEKLGKGNHFMEIMSEAPKKAYLHSDGSFATIPDMRWYDQPNIVVVFEKGMEDGKVVSKKFGIKFESTHQTLPDGRVELALGAQVAKALNGENMPDPYAPIQVMGHYTRFLAQLNTRMNPGFALPNLIRDTGQAYMNLAAQYGHAIAFGAINPSSISRAIRIMFKAKRQVAAKTYNRAKADPSHPEYDPDIELVEKYRESGGFIVFLGGEGMIPHLDTKGEVMAYTNTPTNMSRVAMPVIKLKEAFELINDTLENASRLAFFEYGIKNGIPSKSNPGQDMSLEELALGAKNLTVNFEQRGTHGSFLNSMWMFSNANIQSTARILEALSESKSGNALDRKLRPQAIKLLSQLTIGHFVLGLMNQWAGGEDEEDGESYWDKVADYEKKMNTIIMLPGMKGKAIKIPQAYGYNIFPAFGYAMSDLVTGAKTPKEITPMMWSTVLDAFSPFGGAQEISDIVTPTAMKPIVEHARNRDWKGSPIYKGRYGDMTIPDSQLYFDNVSPLTRDITTWLNEATGGDQFTSGSVLGFDTSFNPSAVEHLLGSVTGGLGKFVGRTFDLALSPVTDKDIEFKDVPIVRRFGITENRHHGRRLYRQRRDSIIQAGRQIKLSLAQRARGEEAGITSDQRFLLSMDSFRKRIDRNVKKLREARNKLPLRDKRRDRLDEAELVLMNLFNKKFHERSVAYGL